VLATKYMATVGAVWGMNTENARFRRIQPAKNLSCHSDLSELVTSSLIKGVQIGEMSNMGWSDRFR
jgi:hypothetical protein